MNYADLSLENIKLTKNAVEQARKSGHYQQDTAPGIYCNIWYVDDEKKRPAFIHEMSGTGVMYGISVNYADKAMAKLNKALKDNTDKGWKDYILAEIDKNPILAKSQDACIYDWTNISVYVWTSNKDEVPVLFAEVSKAIRNLVSGDDARLSNELQSALDEGNIEGYTEQFVELMGEGSKAEIALAFEGAKTLLEDELNPELLAAMAVATTKIGTKPLKDFAKEAGLAEEIADMDYEFNDSFLLALQQTYTEVMYASNNRNDWQASKELVKHYYDNISEVIKICGYKVNKMAIMTMIFVFYNDVIEGITFESYMDDDDYRDEEWPYTDTNLSFWKKFDPDTVTGLKTGKGGYNADGDSDGDEDSEEGDGDGFKKYLEFDDGKSHKFWSIELAGDSFTVQYGKVGSDGQTQTKEFDSGEEAEKEALKLYNSKIKKGYEEV